MKKIVDLLDMGKTIPEKHLKELLLNRTPLLDDYIFSLARNVSKKTYKNKIYIRGLIELTGYCKNDCFYCGLRKSNKLAERYRLSKDDVLSCCSVGYDMGFRTFVLQGGEDGYFTDQVVCDIVREIKSSYPDCAVTLSLGERSYESYKVLKEAGADRYLLRHETADEEHYKKLHPNNMSFENRIECLTHLKELGFQTGCGFMVGSPYQTIDSIVKDLIFIRDFKPEMVGIGPFIPHKDTPFSSMPTGDVYLTLFLISVVRLMLPKALIPATTALGSAHPYGRELGILAGANVVMPNLSPESTRKKYSLYNNKLSTGEEAAENCRLLEQKLDSIGYKIDFSRGDYLQ